MTRSRLVALAVSVAATAGPVVAQQPKPFLKGSLETIRQAHRGRPLIVHFWGLSCPPCLVELPHWAALVASRPDAAIVFVGADPVPYEPERLVATLARAGLADVEQWVFGSSFVEPLRYAVDPAWAGELPFTLLVTRDGQATTRVGVIDPRDLQAWIAEQGAGRAP